MREVIIKEIYIENFAGIRELTLKPNRAVDIFVAGDNGAGKTCTINAWWWLIAGVNKEGDSQFPIKPTDLSGPEDERYPYVRATIAIREGAKVNEVVLERKLQEVWRREQGTNEHYFDGNTTEYHVNGTEMKATEYEAFISQKLNGLNEEIRMLTDPCFFAEVIHWEERRAIINDMIDTLSVEERLTEEGHRMLAQAVADDVDKYIKAREKELRKIDKELDNIHYHLKEAEKGISEGPSEDISELKSKLGMKKKELQGLQNTKAELEAGGKADIRDKLSEINQRIERIESDVNKMNREQIMDKERELSQLENDISAARHELERLANERDDAKVELKDKYSEYERWQSKDLARCPECGGSLSAEKREKFNNQRAEKLKVIKQEGVKLQDRIGELEEAIEEKQAELDSWKNKAQILKTKIGELESAQEDVTIEDAVYSELKERKQELEKELAATGEVDTSDITGEIAKVSEEIEGLQEKIAGLKVKDDKLEDLRKHRAKEEDTQEEYRQISGKLSLVTEAYNDMLEDVQDKASDLFGEDVSVKMFDHTQDGKPVPTCTIMLEGKPFEKAVNSGHKFRTGLKIIDILAEHFSLALPVMVDNAESFTAQAETIGQRWHFKVLKEKKVKKIAEERDSVSLYDATGQTPLAVYYKTKRSG